MKTDGTWGGQMEIQAASLAYMVNVTIHQLGQPRWDTINFPPDITKTIHLSYHLVRAFLLSFSFSFVLCLSPFPFFLCIYQIQQ